MALIKLLDGISRNECKKHLQHVLCWNSSSAYSTSSTSSSFSKETDKKLLQEEEAAEESFSKKLEKIRKYNPPIKTGKRGISIVHDPLYNKGTGFKMVERDRLGE